MAKRFKLRFSRVIPSFQFCRSKHPSTFPENPIPSIYRLSPINPKAMDITYPTNFPNPPPSTPQHHPTPVHPSSIKRHVSFKSVTVGCGCRSRSCARYLSSECSTESPDYTWTRNGKWHVVGKVEEEEEEEDDDSKPRRKIYSPSDSGDTDDDVTVTPLLNSATKQIKKQRSKKKKKSNVRTSVRTSTSSGDSGWFTSEENDEETETLVSSRSFSNYSSNDFDDQFDSKSKKQSNNRQTKINAKNVPKLKRHASKNWKGSSDSATGKTKTNIKTPSPEPESLVRTSVLRRMMPCKVEGKKVMESFAVVKKSEDPYEDFRRSMLEMIMEKQMFDAKELEELLHCFLSLNSRHHHGVIVEAFSEIWEVLFSSKSPVNHQRRANSMNR